MLTRLTEETQRHHAGAETDVDRFLFRPKVTSEDYQAYLTRVYGFLMPLETALAMTPGLDEVLDVRERAKSVFVVRDLLALGLTMADIGELPLCHAIPSFSSPTVALGWLYVAEWSLLASSVLRSHLATWLPAEMGCASSYLSCYAGQVGTKWRALGQAIDRVAKSPTAANRIVISAHDAFRTLIQFRAHGSQQIPVTRMLD